MKKYTSYTIECNGITDTIDTITQEDLINHESIPYTFSTKLIVYDNGTWGDGYSPNSFFGKHKFSDDGTKLYTSWNNSDDDAIYIKEDITTYRNFHIKCKLNLQANSNNACGVSVVKTMNWNIPVASATQYQRPLSSAELNTVLSIDIPIDTLSGEYSCGINAYVGSRTYNSVEIYEIWLE